MLMVQIAAILALVQTDVDTTPKRSVDISVTPYYVSADKAADRQV